MIDIKEFRNNAEIDGLCAEYSEKWDSCKSKKQLIDLALEAKGVDYICDAIAKGWGISPRYISYIFSSFINGKYVFDNSKYTSEMYCKYSGIITCRTTILTLIDCDVRVIIPDGRICEIYATGNTKIAMDGAGRVALVTYGDAKNVIVCGNNEVELKRIHKREKDGHEEQE